MKPKHVNMGDRYGKLVIVGYDEPDKRGNQRVRVRCECGTEKTVRLANLTFTPFRDQHGKLRKPARSCGCDSKAENNRFYEERALKLEEACKKRNGKSRRKRTRKNILKRIWIAHQQGASFSELAERFRLEERLVQAACRVYNRRCPQPVCGAIPKGSKAFYSYLGDDDDLWPPDNLSHLQNGSSGPSNGRLVTGKAAIQDPETDSPDDELPF